MKNFIFLSISFTRVRDFYASEVERLVLSMTEWEPAFINGENQTAEKQLLIIFSKKNKINNKQISQTRQNSIMEFHPQQIYDRLKNTPINMETIQSIKI